MIGKKKFEVLMLLHNIANHEIILLDISFENAQAVSDSIEFI